MVSHRYFATAALLIALPLFAFPLVSPPPEPEPQVNVYAHELPEEFDGQNVDGTTYHYANLSAPAQEFFDRVTQGSVQASVDTVPDPFEDPPDTSRRDTFVVRDGQYYDVRIHRYQPSPSGTAVIARLGSFAGSVVFGLGGAYVLFDGE